MVFVFGLEMGECFSGLLEDFLLPGEKLLAEILPLTLIHEWLFVGRSIGLGLVQYRAAVFLRRHCNPVRKANPLLAGASLYRAARWPTITELRPTQNFVATQKGGGFAGAAAPRAYAKAAPLR